MTIRVGDDATITYPVADTAEPPGDIDIPATVSARRWLGETVTLAGQWSTPAGPERDLKVPLSTLTPGLWKLRLVVEGGEDLTLGRVVIE